MKNETCRERLKREHPDMISPNAVGGCIGCPDEYGYAPLNCAGFMGENPCEQCWDREVEE